MVEVELVTVRVEMPTNTSVVLLRERGGQRRLLPILIGNSEAQAIDYALDHVETPRPMTHDLLKNLLDALGVSIEQVVVTELRDRTFYAELTCARPPARRRCPAGPPTPSPSRPAPAHPST